MCSSTRLILRSLRKKGKINEKDKLSFLIEGKPYPFSEPDLISARKRSPALRWVNPKCSTMLAHCVPFPLPGPPMCAK
jgi:hypothetical protein